MKKILVATDFFFPHWTGISKAIFNMTKELQHEIDFTVLTVQHKKDLPLEEKFENIQIIRSPFLFTLSRAKYSISILIKFWQLIKINDAVLINSPCTNVLPFSLMARIAGKKLFFFHQGDLMLPKGIKNRIIEKVFDIMTLISFKLAHKVSTYTRDYAENSRVLKPFLNKFTPLIMPMYVLPFENVFTEKTHILERLKKDRTIIFGFGGRFVEEKGFDILFDAIPSILEKLPNAHFAFAGEIKMDYEDFYEKNIYKLEKVKEHVTILGLLNDKELSTFYHMINFILMPSRSDCFPLVQMEACLAGAPTVVANIPGARYFVHATDFGLIFESQNPTDLAEKVVQAVNQKQDLLKHHHRVLQFLDNAKNLELIRTYLTS